MINREIADTCRNSSIRRVIKTRVQNATKKTGKGSTTKRKRRGKKRQTKKEVVREEVREQNVDD